MIANEDVAEATTNIFDLKKGRDLITAQEEADSLRGVRGLPEDIEQEINLDKQTLSLKQPSNNKNSQPKALEDHHDNQGKKTQMPSSHDSVNQNGGLCNQLQAD